MPGSLDDPARARNRLPRGAWTPVAGFTVEAELTHQPAPGVEGGFVFAHR
ncbi:hypothetical protein [Micromonospora schwarzwaldensis]